MDREDIIVAFFLAAAIFIIIISFVGESSIPEHPNIHLGVMNSSMRSGLSNSTYLRVFFSNGCPACRKQMPVLETLAEKGLFIELVDVYKYPELAIAEDISGTPALILIGPQGVQKWDGFTLEEEIWERVTNKSNLGGG